MNRNLGILVFAGWLVITVTPLMSGEPVQAKGSKWDVVKEYLRKDASRSSRDGLPHGVASDSFPGAVRGGKGNDANDWELQTYKLEHNGYAPYQEFVILDMVTKEKKVKVVGFLPQDARFFYLSPSSPKIPAWVKIGKTRVSRNGFSFKVGSPDGSEVFSFFDSTDEVAPWYFEKYTKMTDSCPSSSASEPTTLETLRQKLNRIKLSRPQALPEASPEKE